MAELATIARPYAEALFRVAKSSGSAAALSSWSELIAEMAQLALHADVQALARDPNLTEQQIGETFLALIKTPLNDEARNLVRMLVDNRRMTLLPEIAGQFQILKNAQEGAADAEIRSAFALTDAQLAELVATLEKKFSRKLNPALTIDDSLIGGVRVIVGDEVLDLSVRARLQQMHTALAAA